MSVVLDAVNTFFGHSPNHPHHAYREAPRAPPPPAQHHPSPQPRQQRDRTPSNADPPMSASRQRAASSSATYTNTSTPAQRTIPQQPLPPPELPLAPPAAPFQYESAQYGPPAEALPARRRIKVRDLEHIQSFANEDMASFSLIGNRTRSRSRGEADDSPQYEISGMKVEHVIEMVAGLLTKITTTNDQQHEYLHRQPAQLESAAHLTAQTSSVLAFHGKNVPSITILSYLSRINKYCPTSYEVFLSLLVYFDRMTERVNAGPMHSLREASRYAYEDNISASNSTESLTSDRMEGVTASTPQGTQQATPPASGSLDKSPMQTYPGTPHSRPHQADSPSSPSGSARDEQYDLSHFFVVDSFNLHRLVIAGVTCASKFFSDIFYTNSRYAKVGGLPLAELNHLELQFLLLNDFRLSVPVEEIEAYGTMLVEFYAREVLAQQRAAEAAMSARSLSESSSDSAATVQAAA